MPGTYRSPADTGLYYLKSRYYNPAWGRFINADGYASTGQGLLGSNMFAYCNNNPVKYADTEGTFINMIIGAVVGAGVSIISDIISGREISVSDAVEGAITGAISGLGIDLAIATGGVALPIVIAGGFGAASGAIDSYYRQKNDPSGIVDGRRIFIDATIGAATNALGFAVSIPSNRVTSGGNILKRMATNSKNVLTQGATKVAGHGSKEVEKKGNYRIIVGSNVGQSVGYSFILSSSYSFWTKKVTKCLV